VRRFLSNTSLARGEVALVEVRFAEGLRAKNWSGIDPMHDMEIVSAVRALLSEKLGPDRFELWLAATKIVPLDGKLLVVAPASSPRIGYAVITGRRSRKSPRKSWERRLRSSFKWMKRWPHRGSRVATRNATLATEMLIKDRAAPRPIPSTQCLQTCRIAPCHPQARYFRS